MNLVLGFWLALLPAISPGQPALAPAGRMREDRELERRVVAIHRKLAGLAPGTPQARHVARDLEEVGRIYLECGETGRSIELLEESYALDGENGLALAELTLAYVRAENFPFARFYLELAERHAPKAPPEAYAALGEVYDALNRLDDAVLAWEQFQRLGGDDPWILQRIARARQELSVVHGQRLAQAESFVLYADAAIPADAVERVAEHLEKSYQKQSVFFGACLPSSQVVVLYAGRAYFSLVSVPEWVSGVFDGKIRVSVDSDSSVTPLLQAVLSHELAHALIRQASADRAPGWLHEGLAQWLEGRRLTRRDFQSIFAGHRPLAFSELESLFARPQSRADARRHYAQMLGFVEYLIARRGEGAVACLVRGFADGDSADEILRRETGLTREALAAGWKSWAGL
ncbi:MAG TPA: hypothetical protein VGS00_10065 [Thermoanaerobaculia bacterium]|nr:hypothetical protein [Thermoanaerobaculia bacterium]